MVADFDFHNHIEKLAGEISQRFGYITAREARREILLWIAELKGLDPLKIRIDPPELSQEDWESVESFAMRRSMGLPFSYILGRTSFYGLEFQIGPGVLIPRPETEEMVDRALYWLESRARQKDLVRILDLCTGSGCIGVALGYSLMQKLGPGTSDKNPACRVEIAMSDLSSYALEYARANALRYTQTGLHFDFYEGDLMAPLRKAKASPFDLILCNPPYVHPAEIPLLSPETYLHEPREALFHPDPPALYLRILKEIHPFLEADGVAMLELSPFISEVVLYLAESSFSDAESRLESDLSGKSRFLIFTCKGQQ